METKLAQYPLDFTNCPCCGSTKRLANGVLESEHLQGKAKEATNAFLFQHQSLIASPNMRFLSAPLIISFFDVCMDCGTVYCVHAQVQTAVQGMKPQTGQSPPLQNPFSSS